MDLAQPAPIEAAQQLTASMRERQAGQLQAAAAQEGASRFRHYVAGVCGGVVTADSVAQRQPYLLEVRERRRREALAQLRTGSHWGPEETMRWQRVPREQRTCQQCDSGAVGDVPHIVFHCPFYAPTASAICASLACRNCLGKDGVLRCRCGCCCWGLSAGRWSHAPAAPVVGPPAPALLWHGQIARMPSCRSPPPGMAAVVSGWRWPARGPPRRCRCLGRRSWWLLRWCPPPPGRCRCAACWRGTGRAAFARGC